MILKTFINDLCNGKTRAQIFDNWSVSECTVNYYGMLEEVIRRPGKYDDLLSMNVVSIDVGLEQETDTPVLMIRVTK